MALGTDYNSKILILFSENINIILFSEFYFRNIYIYIYI